MSKIRRYRLFITAVFLSATLIAGFIPASGALFGAAPGSWDAYADEGEPQPLEDCDFDCYDDHTGAPVPWAGFDETRGDVIPADWDGVAGSYQAQHDAGPGAGGNDTGNNGAGNGSNAGSNNDSNGGTGGGSNNDANGGSGGGADTGQTTTGDTNTVQTPQRYDETPGGGNSNQSGQGEETTQILKFSKSASPKITGTAKVGKKLKVKAGAWNPKPKLTYRWYANGKAIKGATKASYKLKKAQKGKRITVKVTASKSGYNTVTKTSGKTAKVK
jgi:hypothetical protein